MPLITLPREQLRDYGLAVGIAAVACLLQWAVQPLVGARVPFLFFVPAVLLASARCGRGPGLLVALAGFINGQFLMPPVRTPWVEDPMDQAAALLFFAVSIVVAVGGGRVREISERARQAERRLVLAVAETGMGVFEFDLEARTAYLSPSIASVAGLPVSEHPVPIDAWLQRLPPEVAAESRAQILRRLHEHAVGYEREVGLARPDGSRLWLSLRVHVIWERGRAVRLRGTVVDISTRKAVDAQLARTRADLDQQLADLRRLHVLSSHLLDHAPLSAHLQAILEAMAEMQGAPHGLVSLLDAQRHTLSVAASVGFDETALAQLIDTPQGQGACGLACDTGQRIVIEDTERDDRFTPFRGLAGQVGFRAMHSTPLVHSDGTVLGALTLHYDQPHLPDDRERTLADICARKAAVYTGRERAQQELIATQGRFRAVLEASAVPFVILAPVREGEAEGHPENGRIVDFRWTYVNGATARLFGRRPEDMVGERLQRSLTDRGPGSVAFEAYRDVADNDRVREFELHTVIDGREGWFHCVASPLAGSVATWAADITERKRTEALLQDADRRKDEFLATLAHELRNPLAPIRQAALTARSPTATEAQRRWSQEVIERQVRHMALLLDDLLDVSRITRGVLSLHKSGTDLSAVVDGAVETAQPLITAKQQVLTVDLPVPPPRFEADALRVSQVVANLLTNAAKYTPPQGRIRLSARREGPDIVIEVSDNGIGIPPESLPHVFDMFTQLGPRHGTGEGGLGIGLSLARGLVGLHGGTLAAHSEGAGRGSTFTVRLPVGAVPALPPAPEPPREGPHAHARRVLVADDNRDAADSLAMLLRLAGHEVMLAYDGDEAVEAWARERPEICLLDIGMPGRDGNDVARAIRRLPGGEKPLLVAITGWGQSSDRRRALSSGFDEHVTKPVDPDVLMRLLDARQKPGGAPADRPHAEPA